MPRSRKNERIFSHISGPRTANPRPGARAGSGALPQGTFVIWRDEKVKISRHFVRSESFRRGRFRPQNGTFAQILDVFPRGRKPEGIKKICQKGGCLEWDMSHFSSENFDFRVLSEWKRLQFHDQEMSTLGGYTGWPMNCCPATQKVAILYKNWTQNPSNWGSKIGSKIRRFSRFLGIQLGP